MICNPLQIPGFAQLKFIVTVAFAVQKSPLLILLDLWSDLRRSTRKTCRIRGAAKRPDIELLQPAAGADDRARCTAEGRGNGATAPNPVVVSAAAAFA